MAPTAGTDEERRLLRGRDLAVAQRRIAAQRRQCGRVDGHLPGLGKLGLAHLQQARFQIDVPIEQMHRLGEPQAGGRQ